MNKHYDELFYLDQSFIKLRELHFWILNTAPGASCLKELDFIRMKIQERTKKLYEDNYNT
jgi:hypothetical protein